jgi:hypothetical protein
MGGHSLCKVAVVGHREGAATVGSTPVFLKKQLPRRSAARLGGLPQTQIKHLLATQESPWFAIAAC